MTLLHDDPARLRCRYVDGFNIPLQNGLAAFRGLYINEAGMYYSIHLFTNVTLEGPTAIDSNVFSVGVGQAARIELINDAASVGTIFGGKAFIPQPSAKILDAGGNILIDDSSSAIRVSIYSNPSRGKLSPASATIAVLENGVVQFQGLSIDKAGVGYKLKYEFLQSNEDRLKYDFLLQDNSKLEATPIYTIGEQFLCLYHRI